MNPDDVNLWNRIAESSPVVVLILLGVLFGGGRMAQSVINGLLLRLDRKDEAMLRLHEQTVLAVRDNTEAIRELKQAIERNERH